MILSDAIVLVVIWRATGGIRTLARRLNLDVNFTGLVLGDGEYHRDIGRQPSHVSR